MSDSPSDSKQPRSKKPRGEPKPSVTQQYEALRSKVDDEELLLLRVLTEGDEQP
jgi:hypothetical protein